MNPALTARIHVPASTVARICGLNLLDIENRCFSADKLSRRNFRYMLTKAKAITLIHEINNKPAGYALLNYLMTPENAVKEHLANGAPCTDSRVNALLPKEFLTNPILYPAAELLAPLEFGAAATLTSPDRAELMARFKAA